MIQTILLQNEYLNNRLDLLTNINRVYANYNTSYIIVMEKRILVLKFILNYLI